MGKYLKKLNIEQAPYKKIFTEVLPFLKFSHKYYLVL